jgi:hypothetical protein
MTAPDGRNKMIDSYVYIDPDCNLRGGVCISGVYRQLYVGANDSPCDTAKAIIDSIVDPIVDEIRRSQPQERAP